MFHSAISCSNCRGWSLPLSPSHFRQGPKKPSDSSPLQLISPLVNCHFYSKLEEKSHSSWKTKVPFTRWSYPPSHSTAETPVQNCLPVTETQAGDILPLPTLASVSQGYSECCLPSPIPRTSTASLIILLPYQITPHPSSSKILQDTCSFSGHPTKPVLQSSSC